MSSTRKPRRPAAPASSRRGGKRVTLKQVAESLDLSPATVSLVLNRSPVADAIPRETHERVLAAARELGYRPDLVARSLRSRRTYSVGVLVPEIGEGYAAVVLSGVEDPLMKEGYFYLVASHRSDSDVLEEYLRLLEDRLIEGFVLVNARLRTPPEVPAVAISDREPPAGVTSVVIDNHHATDLALSHLRELGHRRLAFFKGHPGSADTEDRWQGILAAAERLGLEVRPELTLQLGTNGAGEPLPLEQGYQEGYLSARRLLDAGSEFTALFAFNDVSAIGAMRAFLDAGLRVPEDVSVVGFDDIQSAAFQNPGLTTVRQPLKRMGEAASRILLRRLAGEDGLPELVTVEPELIVRASTGPTPGRRTGSEA